MMDDAGLTALALAARDGDAHAATALVRHTYGQVWRMMVVLSDREIAEDLTQETYARAFRSLPGFRAQSPVRPWLLSIARRTAADHLRTRKVRPQVDRQASVFDAGTRFSRADMSESVALRAVIDDLEPDRRLAFELTQILGLSYTEAAQVCECPVGTIRSRVARARDDLITALGDHRADQRPDVAREQR